jgi:hypothetical protein
MARIPVGRTYTAEVGGSVPVKYECGSCGFATIAVVRSEGRAEATAWAFIGSDSAKASAESNARADLLENARVLAATARCPSCNALDEAASSGARTQAIFQSIGTFAVMVVLGLYMQSTRESLWALLAFALGLVLAVSHYSKNSWKWAGADDRVRLLGHEEVEALLQATEDDDEDDEDGEDEGEEDEGEDEQPLPHFLAAPVWVDVGGEVVTWPFVPGVQLGLLRQENGTTRWVKPAELEEVPVERAKSVALDNLRAATTPLQQLAPGVYRGSWGDGIAAARLAVLERVASLPLSGQPVAFTSTEDSFVVAGASDVTALGLALQQAREDAARVLADKTSKVDLFTATPWLLADGQWQPWQVPAAHPLKPRLDELATLLAQPRAS